MSVRAARRVQAVLNPTSRQSSFRCSSRREKAHPFDNLVKTYDFKGINQAFAASESDQTIKPVVVY